MKKITTFLLMAALAFAFIMPAKSVPRQHPKDFVKTELTAKIVKTDIVLKNQTVVTATEQIAVTQLNYTEAERPPDILVAKASFARFNRYKNHDALIKPKDKLANNDIPPLIRQNC